MKDSNSTYSPRICDLASEDKPREKAQKLGINALTNAELLALVFGSGLHGKSVIAMSQEILATIDNKLDILAKMTINELSTKYSGIGPAKATSLVASIELGRRCQRALENNDTKTKIKSSKLFRIMSYTSLELLIFVLVSLFSRANIVTSMDCISTGGTASTVVDVKMVMKSAINKLSSALILVHNHPSGNMTPSTDDIALTQKIIQAAKYMDIRVLDHIIIGQGKYYSFADEGNLF